MKKTFVTYQHEGVDCRGYIAGEGDRPVVFVAHAFRGQDDFARQKAEALAELGYIGFAMDIYGEGKHTEEAEEARALMAPFFLDRPLLQGRMQAAVDFIGAKQVAVIGFCFGGLAAYELLRSGAPLLGAISFHGIFSVEREGHKAKEAPCTPYEGAKLLVLHGDKDPFVEEGDLLRVKREMDATGVDWQIHVYGNAMHAFTNPKAANVNLGTVYNKEADRRSWTTMVNFLEEIFTYR